MFSGDGGRSFLSVGGSKLGNIFGADQSSRQTDASFTYQAPKQPRKKVADPASQAVEAPTVVLSSAVHAFQYVGNKFVSKGNVGIALLTSPTTKEFRILVYANNQQHVTSAKITSAFVFNIQENNYASFSDDSGQMWSVMFDKTESVEKFAKEVTLARANSEPLTKLLQQDLSMGEGDGVENGDLVEVIYTGWLLSEGKFGKIFDQSGIDNNFRFKVGKAKVIKGWDQGILGMKKGGKRLLIIPSALAYGNQGAGERVPPNSALILEIQVVRIKVQKVISPYDSPVPTPTPVTLPSLVPVPDQDDFVESGVKDRARSFSEHLSQSPDNSKAKLISRMARMGQPMLPLHGAGTGHLEDSDDEMVIHPLKPPLPVKPRSRSVIGTNSHLGQAIFQGPPSGLHSSLAMVDSQPLSVTATTDFLHQQPAFLHDIPGSQQVAIYQNPNTFLQQQQQQQQAALLQHQQQQQQAALLQHQQQQQQSVILQQQQLLQQQQQLIDQSLSTAVTSLPARAPAMFTVPATPIPPVQQQTSMSSTTDSLVPVLLTETRQQYTDMNLGFSKLTDKVDRILEKMEHQSAVGLVAHTKGLMHPYSGTLSLPAMEASALMQNINRVVQENERLKMEILDQNNKVQEQNNKIADMLERNQKYVEQSHSLLEQRNEGFKVSAAQTHTKLHTLEQEKIKLATELSTASAQISTLQLQLVESNKREGELKQQLQTSSSLHVSTREEVDKLRLQRDESDQKVNHLNATLRDEKQIRKSLEAKLASYQEELAEVKAAKNLLEKDLNDRKRKATEERLKMEKDLEETKKKYEKTSEELQGKLRRQNSLIDAELHTKVNKAEEDMSREWQKKCDRMMATAAQQHKRQILNLKDEKEELARRVSDLEKKLATIRSSGSYAEKEITQLKDELAEMKLWKDKYDHLRAQASSMKDRHERRIKEMQQEKHEEERTRNEIEEKFREQHQVLQQKLQLVQQEYDKHLTQIAALTESYEAQIGQLEKEKEEEKEKRLEVVDKARKLRLKQQQKIQTLQQQMQSLQSEILALRESLLKHSDVSPVNTAVIAAEQPEQTISAEYASLQTDGSTLSQTHVSTYASVQTVGSTGFQNSEPTYSSAQTVGSVSFQNSEPTYPSAQTVGSTGVQNSEPTYSSAQTVGFIVPPVEMSDSSQMDGYALLPKPESTNANEQDSNPTYISPLKLHAPAALEVYSSVAGSSLSPPITADSASLQTFMSATVQIDVSETGQRGVPVIIQTDVLETSQTEVSETAQAGVPAIIQTDVLETSQTNVPETVQIHVPETTKTDVPETAQTDVPEIAQTDVPETAQINMLETVQTDVSATVQKDVPTTVKTDVPETFQTVVTETVQTDVPAIAHLDLSETVQKEMSEIIETHMPTTVLTDVPETTQTNVSEIAQIYVSTIVQTSVPVTAQTEFLETVETDVPETCQTDMPEIVQADVPETAQTFVPKNSQTDIPEAVQTSVPETSQTDISEIVQADVPETAQTSVPETAQTNISEIVQTDVTETAQKDVPAENDALSYSGAENGVTHQEETEYDVLSKTETETNVLTKSEAENEFAFKTEVQNFVESIINTALEVVIRTDAEHYAVTHIETENDDVLMSETVKSGTVNDNLTTVENETDVLIKTEVERDASSKPETKNSVIFSTEAANDVTITPETESGVRVKPVAENGAISKPEAENNGVSSTETENIVFNSETANGVIAKPETENDVISKPEAENGGFSSTETENDVIVKSETENDIVSKSETENYVVSSTGTENGVITKPEMENDVISITEAEDVTAKPEADSGVVLNVNEDNGVILKTDDEYDVMFLTEEEYSLIKQRDTGSAVSAKTNVNTGVALKTDSQKNMTTNIESENSVAYKTSADHDDLIKTVVGKNVTFKLHDDDITPNDEENCAISETEKEINITSPLETESNVTTSAKIERNEPHPYEVEKDVDLRTETENFDLSKTDTNNDDVSSFRTQNEDILDNNNDDNSTQTEVRNADSVKDKTGIKNTSPDETEKDVKTAINTEKDVMSDIGFTMESKNESIFYTDSLGAIKPDVISIPTEANIVSEMHSEKEKRVHAEAKVANNDVQEADGHDTSLLSAKENTEQRDITAAKGAVTTPVLTSDLRKSVSLLDDLEDEDEDRPLFGSDNTVLDTLGSDFKPTPVMDDAELKPVTKYEATMPQGRTDRTAVLETLEPPPRSLFGDDDEDELDWLS